MSLGRTLLLLLVIHVLFLLAAVGASPAAGRDQARGKEPRAPSPPPVTVPAEGFTHPGSPRTRWRIGNETVEEYRTPGTRRSDFTHRGKRIDCYRSFTGRIDCK